MKKFWIVFILVAVVIGGGFGLLWYSLSSLEKSVSIDGGVLVWEVKGNYAEERDDSFWGQVRGGGQMRSALVDEAIVPAVRIVDPLELARGKAVLPGRNHRILPGSRRRLPVRMLAGTADAMIRPTFGARDAGPLDAARHPVGRPAHPADPPAAG